MSLRIILNKGFFLKCVIVDYLIRVGKKVKVVLVIKLIMFVKFFYCV